MPASLAPTPGSMASLSIEEGSTSSFAAAGAAAGAFGGVEARASIETGSATVVVVPEKTEEGEGGAKDAKKKKNKCLSCKKKVGLTGFICRCGGMFCSIHRYSDKHACAFDYKALGAEEISKNNPTVVAEKVAKI